MMPAPLLCMTSVSLAFGETQALAGVDFEVRAGEVHALLGENGAGKSSMMQVLAGVHRPQAGSMTLGGHGYAPRDPRHAQQSGVAMIHQELSLLPHLSVLDNVCLGHELRTPLGTLARSRAAGAVRAVLARLGHSDIPLRARVRELAPAARQMVEVARALHAGSRILVMDEPTSSLAADDVAALFTVIDQLRSSGLAIVYISHFLEEVRRIADHCTVLRDGCVVAGGALAEVDDATLVAHMAGRPVAQVFPRRRSQPGDVVLEVRDLAGAPLPLRASLQLRQGEILGIGGLCGAGRSELLEALFGLRPALRGAVRYRGLPAPVVPAALWSRGLGLLVEDRQQRGLARQRAVDFNLVLPSAGRLCRGPLFSPRAAAQVAATWIERLRIRCRGPLQRVGLLSGGNQQKVALARLLQAGAEVLLLDEPTRGIDVGSRQEIYALLDELARNGAAILLVSSQLPELLGLCDRIAVMRAGVLGTFMPAVEWTKESLLQAALLPNSAEPP
ncbi:MAG TPA: sugar ABC transporter ATP-binding protein [Planctomycetota bacterium]|nr:sugar ABC transporter ATP-binding protein [Planctomycetota bacterium]